MGHIDSAPVAKNSKQQEKDRRARVEAMREAERAKEQRKSMLFIALAVVVGVGLIAAAAIPAWLGSRDDPANKDLASFGVSRSAADCTDVETENTQGQNDHHPPGSTLEYETVPPSSGPHTENWVLGSDIRPFYTERDHPPIEELVHNLEHGYTILWYDPDVPDAKKDVLRDIAQSGRQLEQTGPNQKFLVTAWDDSYGELPEGEDYVLTHWGAEQGFRQSCGDLSGAVVEQFIEDHPWSNAPEPNAV
jgi:hypothetical protein